MRQNRWGRMGYQFQLSLNVESRTVLEERIRGGKGPDARQRE
jgi:hypothetical protein